MKNARPSHLRPLHLYDTFEGMTPPTEHDHVTYNDQIPPNGSAAEQMQMYSSVKAYAGLDEVRATMRRTGYPSSLIQYHGGPIERTLPTDLPDTIAILRLDTDWYESTAWELNNMHDRVSSGGVVILDDYNAWSGSKMAADEFLASHPELTMHATDTTGTYWIKP